MTTPPASSEQRSPAAAPGRPAERPPRSVILPPRAEPPGVPRWVRRMAFGGSLAVLATLIPVLARFGWEAVLDGSGSVQTTAVVDPASPGYEALVSPTPTTLVLHVGPTGALASVVLLARTGDGSGAALLVPIGTLVGSDTGRPATLADLHARAGADGVADGLGHELRLGFGATVTVDPARWNQLAAAVGPLRLSNPDDLVDETGEVRFTAGDLELPPGEVEAYLRLRNPEEDDRARLYRQERFWKAWLDAIRSSGGGTAVGEAGGLSTFVNLLAAGTVEVVTMPVDERDDAASPDAASGGAGSGAGSEEASTEDGEDDTAAAAPPTVFALRTDEVRSLMTRVVPFPTSARPGDRVRIRLLDGTGTRSPALEAADILVAAGAEVAVFGNARSFEVSTTTIEFHDPTQEANATALVTALGVGAAVRREAPDAITDLTVTIGRDFRTTGTGRTALAPIATASPVGATSTTTNG